MPKKNQRMICSWKELLFTTTMSDLTLVGGERRFVNVIHVLTRCGTMLLKY